MIDARRLSKCPICGGAMPIAPEYDFVPYCNKCSEGDTSEEHRKAQWYVIGFYLGTWAFIPPKDTYPEFYEVFKLGKQDRDGTES